MDSIKTDLDLSNTFKGSVGIDYKTALEFLTVYPDYSLVKFRDILSFLCEELAELSEKSLDLDKPLWRQMDILFESGITNDALNSNLHEARKLGNAGAHKVSFSPLPEGSSQDPQLETQKLFRKRTQELRQKAEEARKLIIEVLKDTFSLIKNGQKVPPIKLATIGAQEYKEILFEAANSECDNVKLKAGVLCQHLAEQAAIFQPLIVSNSFHSHHTSLYKVAASHYEASYKISANTDAIQKSMRFTGKYEESDALALKYCQLEPLYKYGHILSDGHLGEEHKEKGNELIKIAADRGYSPAQAEYGAHLYDEKDYKLAKKYFDKAEMMGEPLAYRGLFYYFSKGDACETDNDLAFKYLDKGVSINDPDSIAMLGEVYHQGSLVEKDDKKAEELLLQSIDMGSFVGKRYYLVEFKDLAETVSKKMKAFSKELQKAHDKLYPKPITNTKKVGVNEKCPCGSGKKYKKCCRDN